MREILLVIGLFLFGMALRSCRAVALRKLGAAMFLGVSFLAFYFLFGTWWAGWLAVLLWFLLPWVELLTRIRKLRLPIENKLRYREVPNEENFPNAAEAIAQMDEAGYEHVGDSGWEWGGMQQYFRIFWHAEKRLVAAVCLCQQEHVAFAFLTMTSETREGQSVRTTNYPFSPTLKCLPRIRWNLVSCEHHCFEALQASHAAFLQGEGLGVEDLLIPDPDEFEQKLEKEMREQIDYNIEQGVIRLTGDGHFKYSSRGLFFLWRQMIKDIVRLA